MIAYRSLGGFGAVTCIDRQILPLSVNWPGGFADGHYRPVFTSSRLPNIPLFELSRSQTIQLICAFISPKLQLAGYLVWIVIPRYLGIVYKISHYFAKYPAICPVRLHQTEDSHYARTLRKISWANFSRSRSKLELMRTRFVISGLFPKSEIAGYLAISRWWRRDL